MTWEKRSRWSRGHAGKLEEYLCQSEKRLAPPRVLYRSGPSATRKKSRILSFDRPIETLTDRFLSKSHPVFKKQPRARVFQIFAPMVHCSEPCGEEFPITEKDGEMAASVLQTYLRLQLLELGGEDERLQKLTAASNTLAAAFAEAPKTALSVFIAVLSQKEAFDFSAVAAAVENEWSTFHGVFQSGAARTLYEAVSLEAIEKAIKIQPALGTAVSLLFRNFGPHVEIGKNKPVFDLVIKSADAAFDMQSDVIMAFPGEQRSIVPGLGKASTWDRAALQKRVEAAVGPTNRAGQANEKEPNAHWPNAGNPWSYDFADRLTVILADYLDAVGRSALELDKLHLEELGKNFQNATKDDRAMRRSIALLWWRQALFSKSAEKAYRDLNAVQLAIHAVVDLAKLIPTAYERAFESFLVETVLALLPTQPKVSSSELLKPDAAATAALNGSISNKLEGLLVSSIIAGEGSVTALPAKLPVQKWAVWLLREVKALQAVENPAPIVQGK